MTNLSAVRSTCLVLSGLRRGVTGRAGRTGQEHSLVGEGWGDHWAADQRARQPPAAVRRHHRAVHESGWRATLHDDGTMTFRRRGLELTTVPFRARRARRPHATRRHRSPRGTPPLMSPASVAGNQAPPF